VSISIDGGATFTNRQVAPDPRHTGVTGVYVVGDTVYASLYGGGLAISTNGADT
jgi:hypothetical protein